jgi:pimeloyl-ACP methyl ester carboxylesterase
MDERRYREAERRLWDSLGVTPSEHRIDLRLSGVKVRVQEIGAGPPVLFVHGANTSGASWASLVARIEGFRCLVLDRPGTGLSEPVAAAFDAAGLRAFADALVADVVDALGLESAHVVATSFGGYMALRSAAAHPDRFRRMVQFSWPVGAPIDRLPAFIRMGAVPGLRRLLAAMPPSERAVRMMFRGIGHRESLKADASAARTSIATWRSCATRTRCATSSGG